jgi:hypothetical protein
MLFGATHLRLASPISRLIFAAFLSARRKKHFLINEFRAFFNFQPVVDVCGMKLHEKHVTNSFKQMGREIH